MAHAPLAQHLDVPLQVHARYGRIEILAAFGVTASAKIATCVYEARPANAEHASFAAAVA